MIMMTIVTPCFRNECDIHLYNMFPYFIESGNVLNPRRDRVYTITGGKYNLSAPDINFTATTEDVFKIGEDGKLFISESHSEVDADTTPLHILTGLFLLIGAVYTAVSGIGLGIAPFLAGAVFGVQDIAANVSDPDMPAGVGKFIADKFFPKDITLPGLPSFPLRYKKFVVGPALLKAAGSMD